MKVEIVDGALTRELRRSVLRPTLTIGDPLPGDELDDAVHFAILDAGQPLSTCWVAPGPCPWRPEDRPAWHLRQMATVESRRGEGLGGQVVAAVVRYVAEHGGGVLWCNARERAVPMYERAGFQGEGAIFTDERHTIPHLRMWRQAENLATDSARLDDVGVIGRPG